MLKDQLGEFGQIIGSQGQSQRAQIDAGGTAFPNARGDLKGFEKTRHQIFPDIFAGHPADHRRQHITGA